MSARRGLLAALLALVWLGLATIPGMPASVRAANPWTLALAPLSITEGVQTNISATVTDGSEMIGCVVFDVPAGFTVLGASISSVPAGFIWTASVAGTGPTWVTFRTSHNSWRLNGSAHGIFVIRVVANASPLPAWTAGAYKGFTINSTQLDFGPLTPPGAFSIHPAATPTPPPTPTPMPRPTPGPTPTPTPKPTPGPTPAPTTTPRASTAPKVTATPARTAAPKGQPGATPIPIDSPSPEASPSAVGSDEPVTAATPSAPGATVSPEIAGIVATPNDSNGGVIGGFETTVDVAALPDGGTVQLDSQAFNSLGMFAWMVPGLFLSLPGLLLILVIIAQGSLASVFVPITRRVLGRTRRRKPGRVPVSPR
jgi:hypothetical protein